MGVIDSATITLTCPSCGQSESSRILDKGSGWNGSWWGIPKYTTFEAVVKGGYKDEPEVTATCPNCNLDADVSVRYGT